MLYLHVNPRLSQESESKVTYTTITSISECFTFMWILLWVMDLNSKLCCRWRFWNFEIKILLFFTKSKYSCFQGVVASNFHSGGLKPPWIYPCIFNGQKNAPLKEIMCPPEEKKAPPWTKKSAPLKSPIRSQIYRRSPKVLHGTQGDMMDQGNSSSCYGSLHDEFDPGVWSNVISFSFLACQPLRVMTSCHYFPSCSWKQRLVQYSRITSHPDHWIGMPWQTPGISCLMIGIHYHLGGQPCF